MSKKRKKNKKHKKVKTNNKKMHNKNKKKTSKKVNNAKHIATSPNEIPKEETKKQVIAEMKEEQKVTDNEKKSKEKQELQNQDNNYIEKSEIKKVNNKKITIRDKIKAKIDKKKKAETKNEKKNNDKNKEIKKEEKKEKEIETRKINKDRKSKDKKQEEENKKVNQDKKSEDRKQEKENKKVNQDKKSEDRKQKKENKKVNQDKKSQDKKQEKEDKKVKIDEKSENKKQDDKNKKSTKKEKEKNGELTKQKKEENKKLKKEQKAEKKKVKKERKEEKRKIKKEKQKKHRVIKFIIKFILIIIILLLLAGIAAMWGFAGLLLGWFGNNDDIQISKEDLQITVSNSVIVDQNGTVLADLSGDEKRKIITLEDMADNLANAYIAIEDERFYEHNGVDFKRTAGAVITTLLNGESSYGASTITQQLVKNITEDNESTGIEGIKRKIREWQRAYQVESMISKEEILELYLNILFVGGSNLHGVELGAEYYFDKSAKDLSLAECAFMAGINHSPNSYNPFSETEDNTEKIKNRTIVVLNKMLELGYITNEEYDTAVAEVEAGLNFGTGSVNEGTVYSYHTDAVISQVVEQVMEEKGLTEQMARNYVYSSGLTIYSTVDLEIQNRLEEEYAKEKYIISGRVKNSDGTLLNEHSQSGMAIIDYKTGNVVAVVGGLGEKTEAGWNRATQMEKQTGSSIKPLAVVAPALEEKIITAATVYNDSATRFGKNYEPENYNGFKGYINIRSFIRTSQNIPAVKIMVELTPAKSLEYLQNMGISSLDSTTDNVLSLALGGMTSGVSPLEMAAAYGTIANDGVYIEPTFYTSVVDSDGNVVLEPNQETRRVLSEENAYILKTIIQEPVKSGGTATYCAISGMDVAAKTGTTDNSYDRWLCGFTPYYAAATWYGYDNSEAVYFNGNPAGQIWSAVMTDIHQDLPSATFTRPDGIVEKTVCTVTGCLASKNCTSTYTEIFTEDNLPEECTTHKTVPKETLGLWTSLSTSR